MPRCVDHNCPNHAGASGFCDPHAHQRLMDLMAQQRREAANRTLPVPPRFRPVTRHLLAPLQLIHSRSQRRCAHCRKPTDVLGQERLCLECEEDYLAVKAQYGFSLEEWAFYW